MRATVPTVRRVLLLGSTGSIGRQTLDVIAGLNTLAARGEYHTHFQIVGLSAGRDADALLAQAAAHDVRDAALFAPGDAPDGAESRGLRLRRGPGAAERLVREVEANVEFAGQYIPGAADRADKIRRFLGWLAKDNFVFMGARRYAVEADAGGALRVTLRAGSGLGLFRDDASSRFATPLGGAAVPEEIREQLADARIILIGKSRIPSLVHRAGRLDRVLVKEHDESGQLSGFTVVCGLFTFRALRTPGSQIPLLYERLEAILAEKQAAPQSHRQKAIVTTFDQTPAEFLLASHPDACARVIEDIIAAEGSDEPQLVLSVDANRRSLYAAVVMPRYRYRDELRGVIEAVLAAQFGPLHADSRTSFIEEDTALIHLFCTPVGPRLGEVSFEQLERAVREKVSAWIDRLAEALGVPLGADAGLELAAFYEEAFSEPYRADTHPDDAARDVLALERLHASGGVPQFAFYNEVDAPHDTQLKIFLAQPRLLSELLPIVDRFGIQVVDARRESVRAANRAPATLVALRIVSLGEQRDLDALLPRLGDALRTVLGANAADDALSALVDKSRKAEAASDAETDAALEAERARAAIGAGDRLAASEIDKMRAAVSRCWNASAIIGAPEPEKLVVELDIDLNRDGTLAGAPRVVNALEISLSGNRFWKVAEQNAVRAVQACAPYDFFDPMRYNEWKAFTLNFDPSVMAGF